MIGGLTRPLEAQDVPGPSYDRSTPRLLDADTEDNLHGLFKENRWTDFPPIVLPTEERVAAMLSGTSHAPDEVVGRLRPTAYREFWEFTVEKVAVNAVMAGARPAYLPVILAMAASGVSARSSTTTSQATVALVNGPIRDEIGMHYGIGALGPYSHANATIGRAYGLLSQNLQGGSVPGETYMGSQGNFLSYNATFAENEEASPWEPFHVQHGFKPEDSTVSLFLGGWYTIFGGGPRETWEQKFTRSLQACDPYTGPIVALDPLVARGFVDRGFKTKQQLIDWCVEHARLPAREYWDNQWIQTLHRPRALAGVEPYASTLKAAPDELVRIFRARGHPRGRRRRGNRSDVEDDRRHAARRDGLRRRLALAAARGVRREKSTTAMARCLTPGHVRLWAAVLPRGGTAELGEVTLSAQSRHT